MSSWISQYTNVIRKDRGILNGKEIDIYLPDYNIGIEFNGLYYHSNLFVDNNYHVNKSNLANEKGIKLNYIIISFLYFSPPAGPAPPSFILILSFLFNIRILLNF
jgi:hypothetical protein